MGKPLGELGGTDRSADPDNSVPFTYFGEPMRTHPGLSELVLVDFQLQLHGTQVPDGVDLNDPDTITPEVREKLDAALPLMHNTMKRAIHEDDFGRFWQTALDKGQRTEDLMRVFMTLVADLSERPTRPSSGSSTGRRDTKKKSERGGPSRVKRRYEKRGRPDLAEFVLIKMEHDREQASA